MFEPLARYAEMGAALCPIPANGKNPTGLIGSFATDWSCDPNQWLEWSRQFPNCNWIMIAGPSNKIIVDIDVKKGVQEAWDAYCKLCFETWHMQPPKPHVTTPSGGWHIYFDAPPDISRTLRQPSLINGVIDVRAGNGFVVIPPSQIDGKAYQWLDN